MILNRPNHWLGFGRSGAVKRAAAASYLLDQIQTPTLAWGDISAATPWYSDAGTTPAVPTDGVYRLTEHVSGSQYLQQTTAGARPTLSAADLNGRSYLTFDGGDFIGTPASIGKSGDFAAEIVAVCKMPTGSNQCLWAIDDGGAISLTKWFLYHLNTNICTLSYWGGSYDKAFPSGLDANWHVIRARKTAGGVNTTSRVWLDGSELSLGAATDDTPNLTDAPFWLGTVFGAPSLLGSVAAVLYYSSTLTDGQANADDAALASWFGL